MLPKSFFGATSYYIIYDFSNTKIDYGIKSIVRFFPSRLFLKLQLQDGRTLEERRSTPYTMGSGTWLVFGEFALEKAQPTLPCESFEAGRSLTCGRQGPGRHEVQISELRPFGAPCCEIDCLFVSTRGLTQLTLSRCPSIQHGIDLNWSFGRWFSERHVHSDSFRSFPITFYCHVKYSARNLSPSCSRMGVSCSCLTGAMTCNVLEECSEQKNNSIFVVCLRTWVINVTDGHMLKI